MSKKYILRADASSDIGYGHVMRLIALGQMLEKNGQTVYFATHSDDNVKRRIIREGFDVLPLGQKAAEDKTVDVNTLVDIGKDINAEWIVLDGYSFDTKYQEKIKKSDFKLMCVDDLAKGHCLADVVLNQNIKADITDYSLEEYAKAFIGPSNSLLRKEFIDAKQGYKREEAKEIKNILVTMGGSDPDNITLKVLKTLEYVDLRLQIKVVVGALNKNYESIYEACEFSKNDVEIYHNVRSEMPDLMKWADLGICAAGSTIFEAQYLGLPIFYCSIADNQEINLVKSDVSGGSVCEPITQALKEAGNFYFLNGVDVKTFDINAIL